MGLNLEKQGGGKVYNQSCKNKYCNSSIVLDGNFQDDIKTQDDNIIIRSVAVIKIDKKSGAIMAKCKKCKTWNELNLRVAL